MATKFIKMSVNLPDDVVKVLKALAETRHVTMTEVLRRAISTEKFLDDVNKAQGKILIEDTKGQLRQMVFR